MNNCIVCGEPCASDSHLARYCAEHVPEKPAPTRPSMRAAINAKCKDCIYDPLDRGNWLDQVAGCSCPECPLFDLRPGRKRAVISETASVEQVNPDERP